jgi:hypothetical protein
VEHSALLGMKWVSSLREGLNSLSHLLSLLDHNGVIHSLITGVSDPSTFSKTLFVFKSHSPRTRKFHLLLGSRRSQRVASGNL